MMMKLLFFSLLLVIITAAPFRSKATEFLAKVGHGFGFGVGAGAGLHAYQNWNQNKKEHHHRKEEQIQEQPIGKPKDYNDFTTTDYDEFLSRCEIEKLKQFKQTCEESGQRPCKIDIKHCQIMIDFIR